MQELDLFAFLEDLLLKAIALFPQLIVFVNDFLIRIDSLGLLNDLETLSFKFHLKSLLEFLKLLFFGNQRISQHVDLTVKLIDFFIIDFF